MANYASLNVCPTCSKSYKRPEHLRRHQISHGTERPHECMGCGNTFQRSDVLKRHLRTCDNLFDHPAQSTEPSVKRRALSNPQTQPDPTISLLDSYDLPASTDENSIRHGGGAPSFTNIAGWVSCGLSSHDFDVPSDSWQDFLNLGSGVQSPASAMSDERHHDDRSLNFLANFTSETGLVDAFDCGTLEQRRRVATSFQNDVVGSKKHTAVPVPACADSTVAFAGNPTTSDVNEEYNSQAAVLQWLSDPLSLKSHEIITSIKDVVLQQSKNSCVDLSWSNTAEEACLHFFSPMNIRRYIHFYWAIWHPNVNIMHKATFHSASAKPALVAAMSVMGACVSPEPSDREDARRWFNCVEELVFSIDDLCDDSPVSSFCDTGEAQWWRGKLRALQAAYMVCLYQNWEGTHSSKRRIRRYRYSTMVAAARDTLHNARHPNYRQQNLCDFSFKNFAAREELIRVCLWIFLLDTAFVIFNNLPPRMVIREMRMSPAKPEACFQALTAEDCFNSLAQEQQDSALQPVESLDFASAFEMLYRSHIDDDSSTMLAGLGPLNLFAMTSALHSLIFHYQSSFSCQGSLSAIQQGLQNWEMVWNIYVTRFSETPRHSPVTSSMHDLASDDMWRRVGFTRHASEYWLLAKLMVDRLSTSDDEGAEAAAFSNGLVQKPMSLSSIESAGPLLRQYDQTSMQQVNNLISEFQKVCIRSDSKD